MEGTTNSKSIAAFGKTLTMRAGAENMDEFEATVAHMLTSTKRGDSEVERIAKRIERRRKQRVPVTFKARVRFLHGCRKIARTKEYDTARISLADLQHFRNQVREEVKHSRFHTVAAEYLGIRFDNHCLLNVLNRAVEIMDGSTDNWFRYMDYSHFHTKVESRWPWMRTEMRVALLVTFLYYLFTPILFCNILHESGICEGDENSSRGWVSSLYFASTTISTVGYGDLTVAQDVRWRSFIGSMYAIFSVVISAVAVSAAAGAAVSPFEVSLHRLCNYFLGEEKSDDFLYKRIRRAKFTKLGEITIQFFFLNLLGIFAVRIAVAANAQSETWMTTFYWAVQTTTTIGYGDVSQSFGLRWFKIFYLILSTYSVGNCLGKLQTLKSELKNARRRHAWQRTKVTKRYIEETQASEEDDKVDQYEFLVASLLTLGKLTSEEIEPIMDKYRELAGNKGFILVTEDAEKDNVSKEDDDDLSKDVVDMEE